MGEVLEGEIEKKLIYILILNMYVHINNLIYIFYFILYICSKVMDQIFI